MLLLPFFNKSALKRDYKRKEDNVAFVREIEASQCSPFVIRTIQLSVQLVIRTMLPVNTVPHIRSHLKFSMPSCMTWQKKRLRSVNLKQDAACTPTIYGTRGRNRFEFLFPIVTYLMRLKNSGHVWRGKNSASQHSATVLKIALQQMSNLDKMERF